jgi:hypothetical protein
VGSTYTNSCPRRPAMSGGGRVWFSDSVSLVEWTRCSLRCSVSSTGPHSSSPWTKKNRGGPGKAVDGDLMTLADDSDNCCPLSKQQGEKRG